MNVFLFCSSAVSDFDLMLMKKKEEMGQRRRKRKDVDIINDNDDLIAELITRMKTAAQVKHLSCSKSYCHWYFFTG